MKLRFIDIIFIFIGVSIGIIVSLQLRAQPPQVGSSAQDQLSIQKSLLASFSLEQEDLKKQIKNFDEKLSNAKEIIKNRSSRATVNKIEHLKSLTQMESVEGEGVRITLNDNPSVSRLDFSAIDENFIQASDLRDLINALYLKGAKAISINQKRISPLTPIQSVFDSMLLGNFQISPPFVVEAVGNADALINAASYLQQKKIHAFFEKVNSLEVKASEGSKPIKYVSLTKE